MNTTLKQKNFLVALDRIKMATQGLISIVKNKETIIKIVVGCDGYNIEKVVAALKKEKPRTLEEIYDLCLSLDFGSESSLVVMDKNNFIYKEDDELPERYHSTFSDPKFNPRWEYGTVAYYQEISANSVGWK